MGGWDKRIVPMLDHARRKFLCERLSCCVKEGQHCVDVPLTNKSDRVCVDAFHEEVHGAAGLH